VGALLGRFGSKKDEMSASNFSDEFKRFAVVQVEDRGYPLREVVERFKGVSTKSIYTWQHLFSRPWKVTQEVLADRAIQDQTPLKDMAHGLMKS
jgi:transposase